MMLPVKPESWNAVLAPEVPWDKAYPFVADAVSELFGYLQNPRRFTTAELVEFFYPLDWARGPGITARKRIFSALTALADHQLKDYWEPGEPRPLKHNKKKLVTPKIWRAPPAKPVIQRYDSNLKADLSGDWVRWDDVKDLIHA